ncbi:ABC transporter ATP-binding protein [Lishizhenia sp.]|uniref:ABC transporter ATP-binding protein n=1 Tax=Lishizhenia sp. TaxID=2497594 RepID=UPI00299EC3FE|nr:ATP-binding cassette domain-containing protein [Lishizhenia sp.]MDX1445352.1 ATP-binding cassette domain-containing protein [Lishizhenia sp.]
MIKVEQLTKEFVLSRKLKKELNTTADKAVAVKDVSFTCEPGKVFSLLGPNGAGKTTTMRMLSTIYKPTSGKIEIGGVDAVAQPQEARKKIGFLTGSTGLYARLTPNELIKYFADLYEVEKHDFEQRKKYLYDLMDMHEFQNKRIGKLSTGMKQKVSIARTMIHDPEIVVFDEPTSGLDVITAENIITLIRNCKEEGKTVIFSSHIMSEVDLLCDDLAIIHKGGLLYQGSMADFKANMEAPNITAEFIRIVNQTKTQHDGE